ncbi:hypothetical protein BDR03DRAFT_964229 [Suillus americanus]|nr:hypothetical protein BDR03DRAFT_964229 [Suillus americanus]
MLVVDFNVLLEALHFFGLVSNIVLAAPSPNVSPMETWGLGKPADPGAAFRTHRRIFFTLVSYLCLVGCSSLMFFQKYLTFLFVSL